MKSNYPLIATRPVQAPAHTTLQIIDSYQGRIEALKARGHAYQLIAEEARAVPYIVGMCLFIILSSYLACLYLCFCLVIFLVNSLIALVLFDLGVSRSFVSMSFSRIFNVALGVLECSL